MLTTRGNYETFDTSGTLLGRAFQRLTPSRLRLARGVLIAIGIALCSASPAGQAQTLHKLTPARYSVLRIGELQTSCLFSIALNESHVNYKAVNRSSGALGAWQIINPLVAKLDPVEQTEWAIRYAYHRYGSPCNAWDYWKVNKWW